MLNFQNLVVYLKISKEVEYSYSTKLNYDFLRVITQSFNQKCRFFRGMCYLFQEYPNVCNFTIRMRGNETGHSLECVELCGKCIMHLAPSTHCCYFVENFMEKNLYSVKCYDNSNMNVLTLSPWENFWWGLLIYFDQFIFSDKTHKTKQLMD